MGRTSNRLVTDPLVAVLTIFVSNAKRRGRNEYTMLQQFISITRQSLITSSLSSPSSDEASKEEEAAAMGATAVEARLVRPDNGRRERAGSLLARLLPDTVDAPSLHNCTMHPSARYLQHGTCLLPQ